ncbi:hypothetical protein GGX14DRAFT_391749 [Mycena pura]|uniref:Uncharacterized protein n=1 Tax=Mycena pura TaxID=153505 RepID=A0AAD6VL67_9AGAR|nr:hypothetical protein GGX14DRAFT_391749 [Mycena pura]
MVFTVLNCPLSMVFSVDLPPVHGIHGGGIHGPSAWRYSQGGPIIIGDSPPPTVTDNYRAMVGLTGGIKKQQTTERVADRPVELGLRNFDGKSKQFSDVERFEIAPPGHNFYASSAVPSIDAPVVFINKSIRLKDFDDAFERSRCLITAAPPSTGKTSNLQEMYSSIHSVTS